jgi:HK97 family phage portal protein
MGIFDFFRKKEAPREQLRYAGSNWGMTIIDGQYRYPATIYRGALALPGAWRAAKLKSDLVASLPMRAKTLNSDGQEVEVYSALLKQPSPPELRATTMSSLYLDYELNGNAISVITYDQITGEPDGIIPVQADRVNIRRTEIELPDIPRGSIQYVIDGQIFRPDQILHIKNLCAPGALRGIGVLEAHMETLELGHDLNSEARKVAKNAAPMSIVTAENGDVNESELKLAKEAWDKAEMGNRTAFLNKAFTYHAVAWDPSKRQLIEARRFELHDLALIFNIPLYFLGADQSSKTYSNVEQEAINLQRYSLSGDIARFEEGFSQLMPFGQWAELDLTKLLRADTKSQYEALQIAVGGAFMKPDEARKILGLPPTEGGDKLNGPSKTTPQDQQEGGGTKDAGDDTGAGQS